MATGASVTFLASLGLPGLASLGLPGLASLGLPGLASLGLPRPDCLQRLLKAVGLEAGVPVQGLFRRGRALVRMNWRRTSSSASRI